MPEKTFTASRITVSIPDVRGFQRSYEAAVPELPVDRVSALVRGAAPWSDMEDLIRSSAPHGFLIYSRNDVHPLMSAAGDQNECVAYLMGNHILAQRMFHHDPRAMLYAPLRTLIWNDASGNAWFSLDQPSTLFGSFGIPEVVEVGHELDRELAALLQFLNVDVPEALLQS